MCDCGLRCKTQRKNECACSRDLLSKRELITNAPLQSPNSHLLPKYIFWLNKICDGGGSKGPFLIYFDLREMRTSNGNFKNTAILSSKIAHA